MYEGKFPFKIRKNKTKNEKKKIKVLSIGWNRLANREAEAQSTMENLNLEKEADNGVDLMNFEEGAYNWVNEAEAQSMREKLKIF